MLPQHKNFEWFSDLFQKNEKRIIFLIFFLGALLRISLCGYHELEDDEIFSYLMSTGHSIEHLPWISNAEKEDYIQPKELKPASYYKKFFTMSEKQATLKNVIRAVYMSDTSPPFYYILLNLWSRVFGTSDFQLRFFSFIWWFFSVFVIVQILKKTSHEKLLFFTSVLYSLAPYSIHFTIGGRHYSLLLFLSFVLILSAISMWQKGLNFFNIFFYVLATLAGFLTHYFFAFLWIGLLLWQWDTLEKKRIPRFVIIILSSLFFLIYFWYYKFPVILSKWTVLHNWLKMYRPAGFEPILASFSAIYDFFSSYNTAWTLYPKSGIISFFVLSFSAIVGIRSLKWQEFNNRLIFLFLFWSFSPLLGLVIFDIFRGTYATGISRYSILAMPGCAITFALILKNLKNKTRLFLAALLIISFIPGWFCFYSNNSRNFRPYKDIATIFNEQMGPEDILFLHSYPKGLFNLVRYLRDDIQIYTWSDILGSPFDLINLTKKLFNHEKFFYFRSTATDIEPVRSIINYYFFHEDSKINNDSEYSCLQPDYKLWKTSMSCILIFKRKLIEDQGQNFDPTVME